MATLALSKTVVSTNDLIPGNYVNELLYWKDQISTGCWRIGDITNDIYVLALANGLEITKLELCGRIGKIVGKAGRTVRLYADTAGFFSAETRQKYEVLPFSHFYFARANCNHWQEVLEKSLDHMEEYGSPPSVETLAVLWKYGEISPNYVRPPELPPPPVPANVPLYAGDTSIMEMTESVNEVETPQFIENPGERIIHEIKAHLQPLPVLLDRLRGINPGESISKDVSVAIISCRAVLERLEGNQARVYTSDSGE
jgi:hypothetical protein